MWEFFQAHPMPDSATAVYEQSLKMPNEFQLFQNYPNPFNPVTEISWQLAVGSHATLKVYDLLGNEVAALVNNWMEAGTYRTRFDASSFSSGIYFYSLTADCNHEMMKMIIIK
jgi:hypothetical protein